MAVALKIRVIDLRLELPTNALVLLRPLQPTGTVATGAFQTLSDLLHYSFILIETDLSHLSPPSVLPAQQDSDSLQTGSPVCRP